MRSTEKSLLYILVGIGIIVFAAFAIVLLRPKPEYRTDNAPEAIVHNYLLAIRNNDFDRAHQYLSTDIAHFPTTPGQMASDVNRNTWVAGLDADSALTVQSSRISSDSATVNVHETVYRNDGLIESSQRDYEFDFFLNNNDGVWQIVDADRYWFPCWSGRDQFICK